MCHLDIPFKSQIWCFYGVSCIHYNGWTKFSKTIKYVRFNNASELFFTNFYQSKGILSFHSCFETPQQNSVVEQKDQHLLNVARALFLQSNIPLKYWGECILTTVFLITNIPFKYSWIGFLIISLLRASGVFVTKVLL